MKWFRHYTNFSYRDPTVAMLKNKFGLIGYARYCILIEIISGGMGDKKSDRTAVISTYDLSSYMRCKGKVLIRFLEYLAEINDIKLKIDGEMLTIEMPMLTKLLDNNAVSSNYRKVSGEPRTEQNKHEQTVVSSQSFPYDRLLVLYNSYPKKGKSKDALAALSGIVVDEESFSAMKRAIRSFAEDKSDVEDRYIPYMVNFLPNWEDYKKAPETWDTLEVTE